MRTSPESLLHALHGDADNIEYLPLPENMVCERVAEGSTADCFRYRPMTESELKWRDRRETAAVVFLVGGIGALALGPWLVGAYVAWHFIVKFW